jgi:hypothetical protein
MAKFDAFWFSAGTRAEADGSRMLPIVGHGEVIHGQLVRTFELGRILLMISALIRLSRDVSHVGHKWI